MRSAAARWLLPALLLPCTLALAQRPDVEGAVTLLTQWGPDYLGADTYGAGIRPGIFVRWGRLTLSSGAGWASIRRDDDVRGLGLELAREDTYRISLGLRVDSGRKESASPALAGLGDVKRTIRARIGASWDITPAWELGASWTVDAFNRGGGNLADLKVKYARPVLPWLHLDTGATLTVAGPRYLQSYHGVTAEQSAASGYPEYSPDTGVRDLSAYTSLRAHFAERWVGLMGVGITQMLGPAADSPLTKRKTLWTASAGLGWRF